MCVHANVASRYYSKNIKFFSNSESCEIYSLSAYQYGGYTWKTEDISNSESGEIYNLSASIVSVCTW